MLLLLIGHLRQLDERVVASVVVTVLLIAEHVVLVATLVRVHVLAEVLIGRNEMLLRDRTVGVLALGQVAVVRVVVLLLPPREHRLLRMILRATVVLAVVGMHLGLHCVMHVMMRRLALESTAHAIVGVHGGRVGGVVVVAVA